MSSSKKLMLCSSPVAGAIATVGLVQHGTGDEKQPATAEDVPALLKARVAIAQQGYEAALEGLTKTQRFNNMLVPISKPEQAYEWSLRLLQAQRDLSDERDQHLAALQAHLERMTELEKQVDMLSRDLLPKAALRDVQWHVLGAKLKLAQANAE